MANETPENGMLANETLALAIELLKRKSLTPDDAGCHDLIAALLFFFKLKTAYDF